MASAAVAQLQQPPSLPLTSVDVTTATVVFEEINPTTTATMMFSQPNSSGDNDLPTQQQQRSCAGAGQEDVEWRDGGAENAKKKMWAALGFCQTRRRRRKNEEGEEGFCLK